MKTLLNTKYIKIIIDIKSWGIGIDWRYNGITRPYYIYILCISIELGQDPIQDEWT